MCKWIYGALRNIDGGRFMSAGGWGKINLFAMCGWKRIDCEIGESES